MRNLILTLIFMFSVSATARTLTVNPNRLVSIIGVVDTSIIEKASELIELSDSSDEDIYIHLNSPGGDVDSGMIFIDAMNLVRSRGVELVCFSTTMAASMAFNMFPHCDRRYTLKHTLLLFHPVRIVTSRGLTVDELVYYTDRLQQIEDNMQPVLLDMLDMHSKDFIYHYKNETFWQAHELRQVSSNWFEIVDNINGVKDLLKYKKSKVFIFKSLEQLFLKKSERLGKPILVN